MIQMFGSDNGAGIDPNILDAIAKANSVYSVGYGDDPWTLKLNATYSDFFERDCYVFPVPTGTAANALALAALTPPYGQVICHEASHIFTTECGAPEFFSGGARLVPLSDSSGRLSTEAVKSFITEHCAPNRHHMSWSAISITQPTEFGTLYSPDEMAELARLAHEHGMQIHLDGARFANALVALECTPAELTWKSGMDILSFGTTKNGTMNAEAVVVFNETMARDIAFRYKRAGLLASKMRFMSVQLLAYVANGLWKANAERANRYAREIDAIFGDVEDANVIHPVQTNQVFVEIGERSLASLSAAEVPLRRWGKPHASVYRLVTSFQTPADDIEKLRKALVG
jgi:threonine aldolase